MNVSIHAIEKSQSKLYFFQANNSVLQNESPPLHSELFTQHGLGHASCTEIHFTGYVKVSANGVGEGDLGGEVC